MANGLRHSMTCFGHIVSFIWAKEILEPTTRHGSARQECRRIFWFPENWRSDQLLYWQRYAKWSTHGFNVCTRKLFSSTNSRIDWRTSTCLQKTKTSWKLTSRVGCTILEANSSDILPWRHLLKTQRSLQQRKEGTLRAMRSNSSGHGFKVGRNHGGTWSNT